MKSKRAHNVRSRLPPLRQTKGFLLAEETLKLILAVIAIGFLAYLLFSIYSANRDSQKEEFARASLDSLVQGISAETTEIEIYNPEGWWIASWPYQGIMPNSCSNLGWENCICFFKPGWKQYDFIRDYNAGDFKSYSDEGICLQTAKQVVLSPTEIENVPVVLNINYGEQITITK